MTPAAGMQLATLEEATRMLGECRTIDEAKKVRDLAAAARVYAREAELGFEAENYASEIKLKAEARVGEILRQMAEEGARATRGNQPDSKPSTLEDLGISEKQSHQWQKLAGIPKPELDRYIETQKEAGQPITLAGVLRGQTPQERVDAAAATRRLFLIYDALEALAGCEDTPKRWAQLDHGQSRWRVDDRIDKAIRWLTGLEDEWQRKV